MAGMQFEYDEEGGTFFYFLLSFWALVIIPATYFGWPRSKQSDKTAKKRGVCSCPPCVKKNQIRKKEESTLKPTIIKGALIIGWIIFFLLAYKVSRIQLDYVEYDPFSELEIDREASQSEIRRAYRRLSLIYHPDKETGDQKKFMRIAKAYAALTDEESRKNWQEYGNPDGPEATRFGIALPKWIVERENSMWVLAAYGLVFIIILPIVVGVWWYRSIKFSSDQVLLETNRLYFYFISKTPNMILKRAMMILAASCEFSRMYNTEVQERPSDNEEVPSLMKILGSIQEKNRERPLCLPYSVKARVLLLAHFHRHPLNEHTLAPDQAYVLKKCPYLINEMINVCATLVAMAMSGRVQQPPRLETIENLMKLSQMIVQALNEKASPLQQLPHITPDMLRHFTNRKRDIRHIRDLVAMKDEERRQILRSLSDAEYLDVVTVSSNMPHIQMKIRTEVLDEEDPTTITAGSIVTVTVNLVRNVLGVPFDKDFAPAESLYEDDPPKIDENVEEDEHDDKEDKQDGIDGGSPDRKPKAWEKQKKTKKKGGKTKKKVKQPYQWKAAAQARADKENAAAAAAAAKSSASLAENAKSKTKAVMHETPEEEEESRGDVSESRDESSGSEDEQKMEAGGGVDDKLVEKRKEEKEKEEEEDDDDDWDNYRMESKKENSLETRKKESHPVHCPFFPAEKQEGWWLYVANRKQALLVTVPVYVCSLKDKEEVKVKFSAPNKPGKYQYSVILRSDSYYADFDQELSIKLDVKEAKIVTDHPQWNISDDEDKEKNDDESEEEEDSDYSSEDGSD
ncbi:translocation protein SEC63 homolog [Pomacea canaliculata]|uniref:translocation protein SEC63 homolog n=1 Tax=Pomacea canaliculata TaxID=400727 RepID=UPI000D72FAA3|nr:translocation protein SEC63 homolog [Pomacea canaliculata]